MKKCHYVSNPNGHGPDCDHLKPPTLSYFWPLKVRFKRKNVCDIQKMLDPKWAHKHDNVGGFKWSCSRPCPLGYCTAHP